MSTSYSNTMGSISLLRNLGLKELTVDNITNNTVNNNTINTLSIDSNANAITLDGNQATYNYKNTDPYFTHRLVDSKMGGLNTIVMPSLPDPTIKSGTWVTFINKGRSSFTISRTGGTQIAVNVNAFGQGSSSSCKIITNGTDWYCC
jgi:hypothetical protein